MPQKIHPSTTRNRPAVGRISCLAESGSRPIQAEPLQQDLAAMGAKPIPDHNDRPVDVVQQVPQEADHLLLADRAITVEVKIPAQPPASRRDRQAADARNSAVMGGPLPHDRGVSARGPRSPNQGGQQEARFIDEDPMGPQPSSQPFDSRPVLLDPAGDSLFVAFGRLPFGPLRGKNPTRPSAAEWRRRGNAPRSVARSTARCAGRSTDRWRNRRPTLLSAGSSPTPAAGGHSTWTAGRRRDGPPRRPVRRRDTRVATGRPIAEWSSATRRSGLDPGPVGSAPRLAAFAVPIARGFHGVSCFMTSATAAHELYFYRAQ